MSFYDAIRVGASGAASAYEVERSLRFNDGDSPWLERTVSSSSNRKTFTISAWVKRSSFGFFNIFGQTDTSGSNMFYMTFDSSHQLYIIDYAYPTNNYHFITNRKFRDTSAWYHIVLAVDTTQATNTNRSKLYVNGVQETSFSTANYPSQNLDTWVNHTTYPVRIGRFGWGHTTYFDGYMAEYNFIDGQALTPSSFAETDATTGQWNPIDTSGLTFGTNGFRLKFLDNSGTTATTLGKDTSGNSNNFTPNNFSVAAGAGNDSVEDTPTNNFPTLNPLMAFLNGSSSNAENGNLRWNGVNQNQAGCPASMAFPTTGKWYWEVRLIGSNSNFELGITPATWSQNQNPLSQTGAIGYAAYGSKIVSGTETSSWAASFTSSDVVGVLLDMDNNDIEFYKNNSSVGTISLVSGYENVEYLAIIKGATNAATISSTINFGQQGFSYTPPTGFKALCSANLPDPTIKLPNKHFDTLLWTGDGNDNRAITGLDFAPDWVWIKVRSEVYWHNLNDTVRGINKQLFANETNDETTYTDFIKSFDSNGFTLGVNYDVNRSGGRTYVGWNWNAGGTDGKTYTVKVVSDSGNKYRFDDFGTSAVTLDLAEGGTYIFDQSDSSNATHPLRFYTAADKTGGEYTTGVTTSGTAGSSGATVTITIAASAPTLYYQCSSHAGMGGQINTNSTLGSSNFDGTIQSTCKVNASAGFSIVTWTIPSNAVYTIGHGLGVAPKAIFMKARNQTTNWDVFHTSIGNTKRIKLNSTDTPEDHTGVWNDTDPTSSVFTSTGSWLNGSGTNVVAYCFSEVASFSKFGSYVGNGSSDNTFVFTSFKPAWVMAKEVTGYGGNWFILDNKRSPFNVSNDILDANLSSAERNNDEFDFLSNGFKVRLAYGSSQSFIYLAFAESPFKNARAR